MQLWYPDAMQDFVRASPATGFVVQAMGDLFIAVGELAPSAGCVEWLEREAAQFADRHPQRALYLHFTKDQGGFAMPDDASRTAMNRFVSRAGAKFAASAVVVAQDGFLGSALRSVFSGVLLAVRIPTPTKIFANPADAHAWLRTTMPASDLPDVERVAREIASMASSPADKWSQFGGARAP